MSVIRVHVDKAALERLQRATPAEAEALLDQVAREGLTHVQSLFGTSPPGRTYRIAGKLHTASRPGYPPNVLTGTLKRGMRVERPRALTRWISTGDTPYAAFLEWGTRRMAARPYMTPTARWLEQRLPDVLKAVIP